ncbi:alpha/beta hydrolase [Cryptosporangium aurantiacum]|uniref:Acetyl esterase/lipase n=1 Tax=Cryptosporangium aurantiacum TaxID=134849 RepID=A0A1M7RAD0_9ACTN|nr:alpha/beta hydrolase [Cryptosporangium aurantiacum]SHN43112.1 Acetyl esterase/lipase [Cryptosporangium aurantiacum]
MPIHPQIAAKLPLLDGISSMEAAMADPAQRALLDEFMLITGAPEPPQVLTRDATAPGPHGPVPVRIYEPSEPGADRPALVWMHGGAFVGGDLDMPEADWTARQICARAGAVVVSVDYRLCHGGVHYPVPHDDVVAAFRWVRSQASELGIDPGRLSIGGASAGGNLAIGAALKLRDADDHPPAALLAIYAVAHTVLPPASASLAAKLADVPTVLHFPPAQHRWFNENYLGGPLSTADGYAFGAHADLEGLCPTLVINAEYDDLRPSGEDFAARCAQAGVDVRQVTAVGMLHGFLNSRPDLEPVENALNLMAGVVAA